MDKSQLNFNNMKNATIILLVTLFVGAVAQAQLYFESGVNDTKFTDYANLSGTKTTLHSYNGFRDYSHAVGYLFPLLSLNDRVEVEGVPNKLRVGLGLGFDQINIRALAQIGNNKVPVHYNMAQVLAQANVLFTQPIFSKKETDAWGKIRTAANFNAEAGLSYNLYTNAVRTLTTNSRGYIIDLKNDDSEFDDSYPTFFFAAGLSFSIGRDSEIYGKYVVENAFSTDDNNTDGADETYSTVKRRVMVGLRLDLRLRNRFKDIQEQRITTLEAREDRDTVNLAPLYAKIDALEEELRVHKHKNEIVQPPPPSVPVVNEDTYKVQQHDKGFMYLPDFKHVLFPLNSSYFDHNIYDIQLKQLAMFMQENPNLILRLVGYADSETGSKLTNLTLSERRAQRVYDSLLEYGVTAQQMAYTGAGETLQFSIEKLTENRRTEIIILER